MRFDTRKRFGCAGEIEIFIEPAPEISTAAPCSPPEDVFHPPIGSIVDAESAESVEQFGLASDFIRVTDDQ